MLSDPQYRRGATRQRAAAGGGATPRHVSASEPAVFRARPGVPCLRASMRMRGAVGACAVSSGAAAAAHDPARIKLFLVLLPRLPARTPGPGEPEHHA